MSRRRVRHSWLTALAFLAGAATGGAAAEPLVADPFCATRTRSCTKAPYVAILSAFPAELAPLLAQANVTETISAGDRVFHVGTLAGVRVILVRGGIGLVNAADTAQRILDRFPVVALMFSGVAGSDLDIADVAVPAEWGDGTASYPADASLLAVAQTVASSGIALEHCNPVPPGPMVCLDHGPRIVVGGRGVSADPFGGNAFTCMPGGGPIFGCDVASNSPDATDMETAAVARVAHDAGVPFLGFRGVSDGNGDPLGLPGFPAQFLTYYQLAADNAAAATIAFLEAWSPKAARIGAHGRRAAASRVRAACDWEAAGGPACIRKHAPRSVTGQVGAACDRLGEAAAAMPGSDAAETAAGRARTAWRRAATRLAGTPPRRLGSDCRDALVEALDTRATPAP